MLHNLGGNDQAFRPVEGFVDLDGLVFWQHVNLVTPEEQVVNQIPDQRHMG